LWKKAPLIGDYNLLIFRGRTKSWPSLIFFETQNIIFLTIHYFFCGRVIDLILNNIDTLNDTVVQ
jgi:hypothetical protein